MRAAPVVALAAASSPAVGVRAFRGSGPNSQLGVGMATMLISELINGGTSDCDPAVIEVMRRDALLQEIALSNSNLVAPGSRLRPHLIDPVFYVQGTVATTATSATWNLQLVDAQGNVVGGHTGTADGMAIFDAPEEIAQALIDQVVWGGETFNFTDLVCPGAGLIPNGVPPLMPFQQTQPGTFFLPAAGGTQNVSGALGGAWINTGTVTVTRIPRFP